MRYLRLTEVEAQYGIAPAEIERLAAEGLIEVKRSLDDEAVISTGEVENARLVLMLVNELDVNLPGAEVIVHMRSEMLAMRRQFGKILETLVAELREALGRPGDEP